MSVLDLLDRIVQVSADVDQLIESWEAHGTVQQKWTSKDPLAISRSELNTRGIELHLRLENLNVELLAFEERNAAVATHRQYLNNATRRLLRDVFKIKSAQDA